MKNDFSSRIRQVRGKEAQADFATRIGIGQNTLSRYENGKTLPDAEVLQRVCELCGIEPAWLLLGLGPMRQGEAGSQERTTAQAPPANEPPRAQGDESLKQAAVANERLWQMMDRERELMKEVGELKAKNARLDERLAAREQALRDMRDYDELQEADIGPEETFADIAPTKSSTNR